jgi:hypothetical protein
MKDNSRLNIGCFVALLVADLFCLPVIYVGINYGIAHHYTVNDWVDIFIPRFDDLYELTSWLMLLPLIAFPIGTIAFLLWALFSRRSRDQVTESPKSSADIR